MKNKYVIACFLVFSCFCIFSFSQTTVAFQGGEGTAADNWSFAAISNAGGPIQPGIVSTLPRTGTKAIRAGGGNTTGCSGGANCISGGGATACPMHGSIIQFDPVNVACLSGVQFSVYHRSHTVCAGSGFDASDNLAFEVRLDGGAWITVSTLAGSGDYNWTYTTNPAGSPATVPNPFVYNVPAGTTTFEFRASGTVNRSDEVFYLDDVKLTTTSVGYAFPGTAGLWNGNANDNWFNPCNWNNRTVPVVSTNVTFPASTAVNNIVIQAGQNCQCNNLTLTGSGASIKAEGNPTKVLTCFGSLFINTTSGSNALDFSDGLTGTPDGTFNLYGNWNNNSNETDFIQGESTVNILGSGTQTIALATAQPYEVFYNMVVNKPSGSLVLGKSAQIENVLTLTNGKITTNANQVVVSNTASTAITGQSTASYINGNLRRNILTGPGTRTYDFPVGTATDYELASLTLTNPTGVTFIDGFFTPTIGGAAPNVSESGYLYDDILNAGVWNLTPSPSFTGTYSISLSERGYTNGMAASYIDVKRPNASSTWANPGSHITFSEVGGVINCQRSGLTSFSDFAIALSNMPLAENLLYFNATQRGDGHISLEWDWIQQMEGRFDLERIADGQAEKLGQWEIGTAFQQIAIDSNAPLGMIEYVLYHTNLNSTRRQVATDKIWNSEEGKFIPLIWPNPVQDHVNLQLKDDGNWHIIVSGMDGKTLMEMRAEAKAIQRKFETEIPGFLPGIYLVRLVSATGKAHTLKLVRQ